MCFCAKKSKDPYILRKKGFFFYNSPDICTEVYMIQCNAIVPNGDKAKENYCTERRATSEDLLPFDYLPSNDMMRMSDGVCATNPLQPVNLD